MNLQKMARIGLALIGSVFLIIALACVGNVMLYGLDVGKMYKEHLHKQRLEELRRSQLTFLELCQEDKLECSVTHEQGDGYVSSSAEAYRLVWKSKESGFRFGLAERWQESVSESGDYRSSQNIQAYGLKLQWKSDPRDLPLPEAVPATPTPAK